MNSAESVSFAALKIPFATNAMRTFAAMIMAFLPEMPEKIAEPGIGPYVFCFIILITTLVFTLRSLTFQ